MATYTKKIIFGSAIVLSMDFFGSVIAYLTRMVLARNLTPAEYGLFYAVFTFVLFLLFFRDLGLNQALVKYISEFKTKNKYNKIKTTILSVLSIELLSSSILIIILFILSKYLSENYFKNTSAYMILNILLVYIFFSVLFRALKYIFQGFQKIKLYASSEFLKNLIVLLLILVFFKLKFSIFSPTLAYALVCPILFFLFLPFALKTFPFFKYKIENFKPITKKILSFGIPVFITAVSGKVIGYIDTLMLTGMRSLTEVGVYNVILPSALLFLFFGSSVASVVFPMTSELWAKKDYIRLSEGLRLMQKYAFVAIIPVASAVIAFAGLFIKIFFTGEYISGTLALQILIVGILFYVVATVNNNMIAAIGKPKTVTKIIFIAALVNVITNFILIPKIGINGAAIATSLSYIIVFIFSTYKINEFIKTKLPLLIWGKLLILGILFAFMIFYLKNILALNPWIELFIIAPIATVIYLILAYFLKIINIKEIKKYASLIRSK